MDLGLPAHLSVGDLLFVGLFVGGFLPAVLVVHRACAWVLGAGPRLTPWARPKVRAPRRPTDTLPEPPLE